MRRFIDQKVIPVENVIEKGEQEGRRILKELQAQAKEEGIWALGLPKEIGGGGMKFMDYVYINK